MSLKSLIEDIGEDVKALEAVQGAFQALRDASAERRRLQRMLAEIQKIEDELQLSCQQSMQLLRNRLKPRDTEVSTNATLPGNPRSG